MPPNGRKRQKPDQKVIKEIIHSGHFMVSDIDDSEIQDGEDGPSLVVHESDCDQENISLPVKGFDFESACKETSKTYHFGARSSHSISIDASLTKLFECMTLAYSGKLTSPRWKQFKGLKLRLKEKIRLNNMIWRAWHMQFVMKIKTFVCQFATPLEGEMHSKPEAVVIEGTYWKRRMANITAEYKKWRLFYKDRFRIKPCLETGNVAMDLDFRWPSWSKDSFSPLQSAIDEDFIMDFSDTLFSTFNPSQPFDFPNPREIAARAGIADFIQPGLVQLQPNVDDFMDTFEPLQDLLTDFLNSRLPSLPEEGNNPEDMQSSTSDPQSLFNYRSSFDGNTSSSMSNQANTQVPVMSMRRNNNLKKQSSHKSLQPSHLMQFSGKPMLNIMNNSINNSLLQETSPSLSNQGSAQSFICNDVLVPSVQSSDGTSVTSILHKSVQDKMLSRELADSSKSLGNPLLLQNSIKERTDRFLQKPSFLSRSFEEESLSHQNTLVQTAHKIQVPMETIPQGQISNNILTNIDNSEDSKSQLQSLFYSVNSGQFNKGLITSEKFLIPVQVSNVSSPTENKLITTSLLKESGASSSTIVRRHSYATGQPLQPSLVTSDYMGSRKSRPIAPVVAPANFVMPEAPARHRTRSRSVSSPQSKSKPAIQQPTQATSLTDVSSALRPTAVQQDLCYNKSIVASNASSSILVNPPSHIAATNVLPQNAILAQLLSGHSHDVLKVTNASTTNSTTPVTIIRPLPAIVSTAHTLVFSPIPMATAAGVSDFQRSLLVSAANHVFGSPNSPPSVLSSQSPDSTGSSTCSSSPAVSSAAFDPNSSSSKTVRLKSDEDRIQYKEHRRVCHINAEQKRRCNIKNGFESLHNLLPPAGQSSNSKISKAVMLQRGAEYIRTLKTNRQQQKEEAELLKKQIDELNQAIGLYQSQLPASGAPVSCQKTNRMKEMFEEYVRQQTLQNWKFWIFSLILEPLVDSYNNNVSTANMDEMCKSILTWLDQHCSLVALRPGVLNSLRHLSTTTNILSDPAQMPEEATRAVTKKERKQ